jgi:hypothetical protein
LLLLLTNAFKSKSGGMGTNCACGWDCEGILVVVKERTLGNYWRLQNDSLTFEGHWIFGLAASV